MLEVLSLTIPFFALIFLGCAARATQFCNADGVTMLTRFAFYITLPPFLFLAVAKSDPAEILNWGFIWRYELATILIFLFGVQIARNNFTLTRAELGVVGLNSAYPNYGYIGVPLAVLAFGEEAALPLALILFADTVVLLTMAAFFVSNRKPKPSPFWDDMPDWLKDIMHNHKAIVAFYNLPEVLLVVVKNPLLISVVLGLLFAVSDLQLPVVIASLLDLLAGAAPPVALFALGATLYGQPVRTVANEVAGLAIIKLIAHPLLVAAFFILIPGQGDVWVKVAILSASLPVAANVFVLSHVYKAYSGRSAAVIFASTMAATITVPVVLYFLFNHYY